MEFSQLVDARNLTMNYVHGDQYNLMVSQGQDELQILEPVRMDASARIGCLPNTRHDILNLVFDWLKDPNSKEDTLWLHGLAGSGKSTISTTIANILRGSGHLGAFLFFDRDVAERSDPSIVIRTLAYQLGKSDPDIGNVIRTAIARDPNISLAPTSHQFETLIAKTFAPPLSTHRPTPTAMSAVIVMDALDECGTADKRKALLSALTERSGIAPLSIRTVVTSRAEPDIRDAFGARTHVRTLELDTTGQYNSDDIMLYFQHRLMLIRQKKRHLQLSLNWPGEEIIEKLVRQASGLFVWAATACEFIDKYDPEKRLQMILGGQPIAGAEAALDELYKTALESVGSWDDEDFVADFRSILGVILIARQPLSCASIDQLLCLPQQRSSMHTVSLLSCLLQQGPTVRPLHPSLTDYLSNESRCLRDIWFFEKSLGHHLIAIRCFERLEAVLTMNICNLTLCSRSQFYAKLSDDVTYACLFWIEHTCNSRNVVDLVMIYMAPFLQKHLLHWLEALSILRRSRDAVSLLGQLLDCLMVYFTHDQALYELIFDARRFARTFADSIEEHPLSVYYSALPFAPTTSAVYQMFHNNQIFPFIEGGFQKSWSPLLMVLSTHDDLVLSVAFSPDGSRIVSGSRDMTIRVWDTVSGAQSLGPLRGHINEVSSVAFWPDGTKIVSGSDDRTVRVWDASAGRELCPPLRGHKRSVTSVIVSPDGTRIASGSLDHTICIWQTTSTSDYKFLTILRGHRDWVREVRFSPNGHRIVSCSNDMMIRIWDVTSGSEICPALREHNQSIHSVSWSPDGKYIASGSSDGTVRIRALTSDNVVSRAMSTMYDGPIRSVAFSPDGERIVTGSANNTVRIWNLRSGVSTTFHGHTENVNSVSFSPDGSQAVSGSDDHTLRIWNATAIVGGSDTPPPMWNSWNISCPPHIPMSYRPTMPTVQIEDPPAEFSSDGTQIFEIEGGWIVENASQRTISKLPRFISLLSWSAISAYSISLLTHSGQVIILNFPISSPDEHSQDHRIVNIASE